MGRCKQCDAVDPVLVLRGLRVRRTIVGTTVYVVGWLGAMGVAATKMRGVESFWDVLPGLLVGAALAGGTWHVLQQAMLHGRHAPRKGHLRLTVVAKMAAIWGSGLCVALVISRLNG